MISELNGRANANARAGRTGGSRLEVQREAAPLYALSQNADDPTELWERALLFDASLKQRRLNPGATADLTVATLFVRATARPRFARLLAGRLAVSAEQ